MKLPLLLNFFQGDLIKPPDIARIATFFMFENKSGCGAEKRKILNYILQLYKYSGQLQYLQERAADGTIPNNMKNKNKNNTKSTSHVQYYL
jgi:hypothetical protein